MKKFAFYLPQFHEIQENNEWWGEGFTEWTNVKKAKPLYKGHIQPKHPLNGNYYNLLDKKTVEWQTDLMHEYHVDGLIYYHYYFTGKKLLEKPAENLLQWTDIDQPFFFCWANHDWNRSWNGSKELLIKQTYGEKKQWEEHFQYLLPFFEDNRYEKVNNKPILMLYRSDFEERKDMVSFFDKRCKEAGFNGIYLIETFHGNNNWPNDFYSFNNEATAQTTKIFLREFIVSCSILMTLPRYYPLRAKRKAKKVADSLLQRKHIDIHNGDIFYNIIRSKEKISDRIVHGLFFEWDNTPRHGYRGSIVTPPSKENFMKTMDVFKDDDYVFFNAWNEWAEGMVLEPTEENGYKYLEWIKEWSEKQQNPHTV